MRKTAYLYVSPDGKRHISDQVRFAQVDMVEFDKYATRKEISKVYRVYRATLKSGESFNCRLDLSGKYVIDIENYGQLFHPMRRVDRLDDITEEYYLKGGEILYA